MSRTHFVAPYQLFTGDGTALANSTTLTALYPAIAFDPYYMSQGRRLRIKMAGKLSTTSTPTITFTIKWGSTVIGVTAAITNGSGVSNMCWDLEATIQTRADGASGKLIVFGVARVHTAAGTCETRVFSAAGSSAPAEVSVDLASSSANAQDLTVNGTWSAASASNTITAMDYSVEELN